MSDSKVTLRVVNVTDIYKLNNFPHIKTLVDKEKSSLGNGGKVVSILTGDFLAPYLLSSIDKGTGMVSMLNSTPIDYITWGNHEDDIEHKYVCQRVRDYKGVWINTNMQDHQEMAYQKPFEIITVQSPDGTNTRKIGLIAVLSNTPTLYRKNAFGGATIEDPWDTIAKYKKILEEEHNVDLVFPLCHLYEPQDEITANRFPELPVILSGHDHHTVDRMIGKTRLLKAGADAEQAVVLDISWNSSDKSETVQIDSHHVDVKSYSPDPHLSELVRKNYSVLDALKNTQLCDIPEEFRPLSSVKARSQLTTVGKFLWTSLRHALNAGRDCVDCALLCGGDLRGERDYPANAFFSLEDLKSEINEKLHVLVVQLPGHIIAKGIKETHRVPNPAYVQFDDTVVTNENGDIVQLGGGPFDPDRIYRVLVSTYDLRGGNKTWVEYFQAHPESVPPTDAALPAFATLLGFFARNIWKQIWKSIDVDSDGVITAEELKAVDLDGDGKLNKYEIAVAMKKIGIEVDPSEVSFVDCIMEVAGDKDGDGLLCLSELNSISAQLQAVQA